MTSLNPTIFDPTHLVLELNPATIDQAWSQSSNTVNAAGRWQSYLNRVTLNTVLPWLHAEEDAAAKSSLSETAQADIWEVVNGTAIVIQGAKLVLIPTEASDLSELRVPQEWIDLPQWTADYYLGVQVNVDEGYLRIWGYTTHQKLKQEGVFSYGDRTYSLTDDQLITDINALWVARELCPDEVTQAAVEPITELAPAQVNSLIERLGSQSQLLPRLAVPFATWGALIQNPDWCKRLASTRRGAAAKTPLRQWFSQGVASISAEFGWRKIEMTLNAEGARGLAASDATDVPDFGLAKKLIIANQPYELKILPLEEAGSWRFELSCLTPGCMIPAGFKLRLLTEDLEAFEGNEDIATAAVEHLSLEVDLESGESLIWQVEPMPDNYQLEVLQF
ncbi:MAG: DUF1822 family protein [Cyanobacteria bacterium P01_G01_bin.67]